MKLFRITEDNLAELERIIPQFTPRMIDGGPSDNRVRVQLRRCKEILSDVRWDYGPPTEVDVIHVDENP